MRIKVELILVLVFVGTCVFSQTTYRHTISGQKIYNKETGERISDKDLQNLINKNPNIVLEPCINKYGKVESFEVDPSRTNRMLKRDVSMRTPAGQEFPEFAMRTIDNKMLKSEKLKGKNVLLQFQLNFAGPYFHETSLHDFTNLIKELKTIKDIEAILVTESSKQEVLNNINIENYPFSIVPDGRNFCERYLLVNFPGLVLLDADGRLIGYYNQTEILKLKADYNNIRLDNE